jgi:uncharacterized protein (TIGR02588 family)
VAKSRNANASTPLFEWIMAAVGFALVAATIVVIAYGALTDRGSPPQISVRAESIVPVDNGYLVTVSAENRGDRTAADVKLEGALMKGGATVEKSEMSFQYLPPRSKRRGGLFFTHDPRTMQLVLTPRGYQSP